MPFLKKFKACPEWKKKEQITLKSGSRHTVYLLNGDRHVGDWHDNLRQGKGAELTRSGFLYEGDFAAGLRHGHGVLSRQADGDGDNALRLVYSGGWQRGQRHGWGIGRGADGSWYEGCWRAGRRAGEGRQWRRDGGFYHGAWLDDLPHGQGILVLSNGNCYEGEFHRGLKHGAGRFFHLDSGQLQEGIWDDDVCVASTMRAALGAAPGAAAASASAPTIPPNGLLNLDAVIEESQKGALQRVRSKSAPGSNFSVVTS